MAVFCAVTLLLLCISALVSGAETSFFSLSHNDINRLKNSRAASAGAMLRLLKDVDLLLATILVVNNLVNVCIVILTYSRPHTGRPEGKVPCPSFRRRAA